MLCRFNRHSWIRVAAQAGSGTDVVQCLVNRMVAVDGVRKCRLTRELQVSSNGTVG